MWIVKVDVKVGEDMYIECNDWNDVVDEFVQANSDENSKGVEIYMRQHSSELLIRSAISKSLHL